MSAYVLAHSSIFHDISIYYFDLHCFLLPVSKYLVISFSTVISPASWREGQKLVKILLGPVPKPHQEDRSQPADGLSRTGGAK